MTNSREASRGSADPIYAKWVWRCGLAEVLGFGVAGLIAGLTIMAIGEPSNDLQRAIVLLGAMLGGLGEGLAVGLLQASVLDRAIVGFSKKRWIAATVTVAVLGWFLGMLPSTLVSVAEQDGADIVEPSLGALLLYATIFGGAAGLLFGGAQALTLKSVGWVVRLRWTGINGLAWAAAMPVMFFAAAMPPDESALVVFIASGVIGGAGAGGTVGLITGLEVRKLALVS